MKLTRVYVIKFIYMLIDVSLSSSAIYLACLLRKETLPFPLSLPGLFLSVDNPFRFVFLFWIVITVLMNASRRLYQTRREVVETLEVWNVIKSVGVSALLMIVMIYISKMEGFPRAVLFLFVLLTLAFFCVWRIIKRIFVQYLVTQGYNNFNAVIIGAGKVGQALALEIRQRPELGIKILGFLDDFKTGELVGSPWRVLGPLKSFPSIVRREFVNKVYMTIHPDSHVFLRLLEEARDLGVAVRVVPQGFDLTGGDFAKYNIGFIPILEYTDAQQFRKQAGKRIFDIICALLLLIPLLPLFLVLAVTIKLDSPGSVFYRSRRYGRGGKIFFMLKFRSMVKDADSIQDVLRQRNEADGPIFKIRMDPRITRVGRFLRKYSLDELPQIFNVLKGEMSLVGPRPLPIEQIEKEDLKQLKRLEVRPGITGLWQIRGRSDISFSRLLKWDIWYINNWSFWLDWNILLQTIPVVLKGHGAY